MFGCFRTYTGPTLPLFLLVASLPLGHQTVNAQVGPTLDPPVLTIGDFKMTAKDIDIYLQNLPANARSFFSTQVGRTQLPDYIIKSKLLTAEAERRRLTDRSDIKLRLSIVRESILLDAAQKELEKDVKVSDAELQRYLEAHMDQFEEVRVRRIVIRSSSAIPYGDGKPADQIPSDLDARVKAQELRKRILDGGDFEELAAKFSDDAMTSGRGGDMGFIRRGQRTHLVVPPLEELIFSMKPGQLAEVQQTALGFEIVRVEERRAPKLADVRGDVEGRYRKEKGEEFLKDLRSRSEVKVDDAFFKAPVGAPATGK